MQEICAGPVPAPECQVSVICASLLIPWCDRGLNKAVLGQDRPLGKIFPEFCANSGITCRFFRPIGVMFNHTVWYCSILAAQNNQRNKTHSCSLFASNQLEYNEIRKRIFLSCSGSLLPASMRMCTRTQQVRGVWKCICQPLCSCNTCVIFAWSRADSTRLLLFFKAPADGQSATNLSQKGERKNLSSSVA